MRHEFCDRCGAEGGEGVTIVRVSVARSLDLCGTCRGLLSERIDAFLAEGSENAPSEDDA